MNERGERIAVTRGGADLANSRPAFLLDSEGPKQVGGSLPPAGVRPGPQDAASRPRAPAPTELSDPVPSRRHFLTLAAALPALLALPAEAAAPPLPSPADPGWDATDLAVLHGILAAVFGPGGSETDAVSALTASFDWLDASRQPLVAALPSLFDHATRLLSPTLTAFHALPPAEQAAAVTDWASSSLSLRQQVFTALRQLLLAHAYADPVTWPAIDYTGPWLGRVELPLNPLRFGELE